MPCPKGTKNCPDKIRREKLAKAKSAKAKIKFTGTNKPVTINGLRYS